MISIGILIGAFVICLGLSTYGAVVATKGMIEMRKSGRLEELKKEFYATEDKPKFVDALKVAHDVKIAK